MSTKDLTVTIYIGGERVDKLTEEQAQRVAQKIGEAMSTYYTAHPDEYKKIKKQEAFKNAKH